MHTYNLSVCVRVCVCARTHTHITDVCVRVYTDTPNIKTHIETHRDT